MLALCLLLGGFVFLELGWDPLEPAAREGPPLLSEPAGVLEPSKTIRFVMPARGEFSEIVERPLFSPSRRPRSTQAKPPQAEAEGKPIRQSTKSLFTLIGVVIADRMRLALLQERDSAEVLRIVEGQKVEGWLVEAILPDRLILTNRDVIEQLELTHEARLDDEPDQSSKF